MKCCATKITAIQNAATKRRMAADTMQPVPSLSNVKDSLDLRVFFAVDSLGNWLVDGKRTAEERAAEGGHAAR